MFADTVGGANASANRYSLIETARANNVQLVPLPRGPVQEAALAQTVGDYEALLPWNIELTVSQSCGYTTSSLSTTGVADGALTEGNAHTAYWTFTARPSRNHAMP